MGLASFRPLPAQGVATMFQDIYAAKQVIWFSQENQHIYFSLFTTSLSHKKGNNAFYEEVEKYKFYEQHLVS